MTPTMESINNEDVVATPVVKDTGRPHCITVDLQYCIGPFQMVCSPVHIYGIGLFLVATSSKDVAVAGNDGAVSWHNEWHTGETKLA